MTGFIIETWHTLYKLSFLLLLFVTNVCIAKFKWFSNNTMIHFKANLFLATVCLAAAET